MGKKEPFCLRVHIFQCRGLPSSEASGLLDPYVKIRFMGQKQKTKHEESTSNPCFYQTIEFHEMLPRDLRFAPEIRVEVWDRDVLGSNTHLAGCRFPISAAILSAQTGARVPEPNWHQLRDTSGEPGIGEVLLSLQLIKKRNTYDKFPRAPNIIPKFRTAYLEVVTIGVRDLKPFGFQNVSQPYVQFEMTAGGERVSFTTKASKFPTGKNANFLERKVCTVLLPENPLFAPVLTIKVFDKRLPGIKSALVGTCSVNLANKMPWNDASYSPPQVISIMEGQENTSEGDGDVQTEEEEDEDQDEEVEVNDAQGGWEEPKSGNEGVARQRDGSEGSAAEQPLHLENECMTHMVTERGVKEEDEVSSSEAVDGVRNGMGRKGKAGRRLGGSMLLRTPKRRAGADDGDFGNISRGSDAVGGGGSKERTAGGYEERLDDRARVRQQRPTNFGVGAIGPTGAGHTFELPPVEEDLAFKEGVRRCPWGCNYRPHRDDLGRRQNKATTTLWYEELFKGGGKILGDLDLHEEENWTLEELGIDFPKEWASSEFLEGRNWWINQDKGGNEIENFLRTAPFENYPLFLGAEKFKGGLRIGRQRSHRRVGILKGLIIVSEHAPDLARSDFVDMRLLRTPRQYCCRLYVVRALHLQPKDQNGLADPYLRFKVGKYRVDDGKDKKNIQKKTLNPDFFRCFEFQVTIPGESLLRLKASQPVYDHDRFGADELIGQTVIDLEDRWFSCAWHDIEEQDSFALEHREERGPFKPLEFRDLNIPLSSSPQGQIEVWLDILTLPEARKYPMVAFEAPTPLMVEVRIVCWRSEDVVAADDFSGLRDLYCRFWLESDPKKKRETDTHWRCKNGK
ncbi:unnamed protein product, partial [Choristocarpus tenellus]